MSRKPLSQTFAILLGLWLAAWGLAALAADPAPDATVRDARRDLQQIQSALKSDVAEARLVEMRDMALAIQGKAQSIADELQPRIAGVDARIQQLGPVPEGAAEAAEVRRQRAALDQERSAIDADVKSARLLAVEAGQVADQVAVSRRTLFNARLSERTNSILAPSLWRELGQGLPRDIARIARLGAEGWEQLSLAMYEGRGIVLALTLGLAFLLGIPVRIALRQLGRREVKEHVPSSRLRRSGFAVWRIAVATVTIGFSAQIVYLGLSWADALSPRWAELGFNLVVAVFGAAFVASLGRALLSADHPSWRIAPVSDAVACCLKPYPWIIALVSATGFLLEQINTVAATGLSAALVTNIAVGLGYSLAGVGLLAAGRLQSCAEAADEEQRDPSSASIWRPIRAIVWLAIAVPIVCLLFGYVAMAGFIARQTLWMGVVGITLFLLLQFADDLCLAAFDVKCRFGRFFRSNFGLRPATLGQAGVLCSAALRVALLFFGLGAILAPFGSGPAALVADLGRAAGEFRIGELTVSPSAVATAIVVFVIGLVVARIVRRWLTDKYLPNTELDLGVRNSVSTVAGYVGIILAALWALSALGIGAERLALVASALSVGIGFGLQAIVQNFISGLILLVERPVKVGDWVALGDQEGDIRKIKVRATEIQLGDRSTLVVPNSEFITKTVRNVTLANPLGRIQIQIGVGHDADPVHVRQAIMEAFAAHPQVQADPAPAVFLDSVRESGLFFNAFAFVGSPRQAYGARSEILFDLLERFRRAGIEIARPRQDVRLIAGSAAEQQEERNLDRRLLQ